MARRPTRKVHDIDIWSSHSDRKAREKIENKKDGVSMRLLIEQAIRRRWHSGAMSEFQLSLIRRGDEPFELEGATLPEALMPFGRDSIMHSVRQEGARWKIDDPYEVTEPITPERTELVHGSGQGKDLLVVKKGNPATLLLYQRQTRERMDKPTHRLVAQYDIHPETRMLKKRAE